MVGLDGVKLPPCKYGLGCRFNHSEQVCRDSACLNRNCYRRHPRPCRSFFLRNYCKFGKDCKFNHSFECKNCENLKHLIEKQDIKHAEKVEEKDEALAKMTREISELKKDNLKLKEDKNELLKQLEVEKFENGKHVGKISKERK